MDWKAFLARRRCIERVLLALSLASVAVLAACYCVYYWPSLPSPGHRTLGLPQLKHSLTTYMGSNYGGWAYIPELVGAGSVVFSVGLGDDVSWERAVMERHGCQLFGFDPTPKSVIYIQDQLRKGLLNASLFHHKEEGIALKKGNMTFSLPKNPNHVLMFAGKFAGVQTSQDVVNVAVAPLQQWMAESGHSTLDVLKMDVEGTEYDMLESWLAEGWLPFRQLLVEFHHRFWPGTGILRHQKVLAALRDRGFALVHDQGGQELSFLNTATTL